MFQKTTSPGPQTGTREVISQPEAMAEPSPIYDFVTGHDGEAT